MLTPIAEKLIHNLRHDANTRMHFSITYWAGKGTCGTVGCLAGTAIAMSNRFASDKDWQDQREKQTAILGFSSGSSNVEDGMKILGLPDKSAAEMLFMPRGMWLDPLIERRERPWYLDPYRHLSGNAKPSSDYVEEMVDWAMQYRGTHFDEYINGYPERAARALELVTKDEVPYVDWKRAFEEA